jgi:LmbE family N-acetylglucosaminyl deacetylase
VVADAGRELSVDLTAPARALAVGAHSDDVEFGCGATLAKWAATGTEVHLLVMTDGSKGTWNADEDLAALIDARRQEQKAAAAALGAAGVTFLAFVDGELTGGIDERAAVCEVVRRTRPQVVLGHDPWKRYRLHPDHRHAGFATLDGIVAARDHHFFPEQGLAPHRPGHILLFEADAPDHVERIDGFLAAKVEALLCHHSQWRSTMGIEEGTAAADTQRRAFEQRVLDTALDAGRALGRTDAVEAFTHVADV